MVRRELQADYDKLDEVLSLSGPDFYLRIQISSEELRLLTAIETASWDDRTQIRAGEALGRPVFWAQR